MDRFARIFKYLVLTLYCLFSVIPFIWMLSASFKRPDDVLTVPIQWIPPVWQPKNYLQALFEPRFAGYSISTFMINSIIVALMTSLLSMGLSTFVGYGFAKFKFRGRDVLLWGILSTTLLPFSSVIIPLYLIVRMLGLLDNLWALIIPFALTGQSIFLARQFILTLPSELIDAARVDGAGELQIFVRVVFPLLGPAIVTLGLMTFLFSWNQFLWPLVVLSSQKVFTLPLGLSLMGLGSTFLVDYHLWMAAATLAVLPPLVFFLILERPYLRGLETLSGLKE
ncbi:MAG TPA: carbohydrate ABC transporter permease [Candidatus Limnocylindrales bacterium]|nr:carbohydrate ABC transporter permease [Candidatus Limnocylindrales bacterium]